jgi:ABC-type sugar transport system substrate-binding protein
MKLIVRAAILALTTIAGSHATSAFAQDKDLKVGAIYMDAQGFYAGVRKASRPARMMPAASWTSSRPTLRVM